MKSLYVGFERTNFEELISWFDFVGYPCRERGIHTAQGQHWDIDLLYHHFSVRIYDEKLYTLATLKWS